MLDLHLPRHQQDKQFQKYRRLVPHHLLYRLAAAATEGKMHLADGIGVQRLTRPTGKFETKKSPYRGAHIDVRWQDKNGVCLAARAAASCRAPAPAPPSCNAIAMRSMQPLLLAT